MPFVKSTDAAAAQRILSELRREAESAGSLEEAAQRLMERFRAKFDQSIILARTYATIPYRLLPAADRSFVQAVVQSKGQAQLLGEQTQVLSLLGTSGAEVAWCDRYGSKEHLGIPLLSEDFVGGIPMVAGLIRQLGTTVDWYARLREAGRKEHFGVFAESFFVSDAANSRDRSGRLLIPAQDFVRAYGVRTVAGVGGQFASTGMILVCIFFTKESLDETPQWLKRLPLLLGTVTLPLVAGGKVYRSSSVRP